MSVDPFTDSAIAARVRTEVLDAEYIHVPGIGWLAYDAGVWRETPADLVLEAIRAWSEDQFQRAVAARASQETLKGWTKWQAAVRLEAALRLCRGMCHVPADKLDAHPDLLNTRNGVVDLKTGELLPHKPWYYFTKMTGCQFDPKAAHPDWVAALEALPESVVTWLQIRYGQAITGHMTSDDMVLIQQGGGENGKSTILNAVARAAGTYYHQAPATLLLSSKKGDAGPTPDLAQLRGARMVAIEETPESGRLDVVGLKAVAGTPQINARKLYENSASFAATHSLFVNTNYPPQVAETDHGTWRRLVLVVFPFRFTADPTGDLDKLKDPGLRTRLLASESGQDEAVLAWLVAGAGTWYAAGREFPPVPGMVESDTRDWRRTADHVALFFLDTLMSDPESFITSRDLITAFNDWMRAHGNSPVAETTFLRRFAYHQLVSDSMIRPANIRLGPNQSLRVSRPFVMDQWGTKPDLPAGRARGWSGVAFRPADMDAHLRIPRSEP